jgi:hypothetical protein
MNWREDKELFRPRVLHLSVFADYPSDRLAASQRWADVPDFRFLAFGVRRGASLTAEPSEGGACGEYDGNGHAYGKHSAARSCGQIGPCILN